MSKKLILTILFFIYSMVGLSQELGNKYLWMQSHTDAAWLWRWPETVWVVDKTLNHNMEFMDKYSQYKFIYSAPQFYEWMKIVGKYTIDSEQGEVFDESVYEKTTEKVLNGQLIPADGNWIEPDSNNASGEGLVRQRLYGVRWFKEEFGDLPFYEVVWIPDSFGFPHSLPQIYKKSGAKYFTTTKLLWISDTDKIHFPFYTFRWRSPDGSELLSYQTPVGCNQNPAGFIDVLPVSRNYLLPSDLSFGEYGLIGEYFNNMNLTGDPAMVRLDEKVYFDWGEGSPDSKINADRFSVRWTGEFVAPYSGEYKFYLKTDDGVRFYLNDNLILDKWMDRSPTIDEAVVNLEKDKEYKIKIEYFENGGGATAVFGMEYPDENNLPEDVSSTKDSYLLGEFDFNKAKLMLPNYKNKVFNTKNSDDIEQYFDNKYINDLAVFAGKGDHGEGPTEQEVEAAITLDERDDYFISTPNDFFNFIEQKYDTDLIPVWDDELFVEMHRGTYTSKSLIKKMVREAENTLITTEIFSSLARLFGFNYPDSDLFNEPEAGWVKGKTLNNITQAWKFVCFNHFHDILPGSAIAPVYKDAKEQLENVINFANNIAKERLQFVASKIKTNGFDDGAIVVFNPLSWERNDIAHLTWDDRPIEMFNEKGEIIPSRIIEGDDGKYLAFYADSVSPVGYRVFYYKFIEKSKIAEIKTIDDRKIIESPFYKLEIDKNGAIVGLFDKELNYQFIPEGESIGLKVFMNKPSYWAAWNIGKDYVKRDVTNLLVPQSAKIVADDAFSSQIDITYKYFNVNFDGAGKSDPKESSIVESIILYKNIKKIDVKFAYDWYGMDTLVKFRIPVNYDVKSTRVFGEIPYGVYERPVVPANEYEESKYEWPAQKWVAIDDSYNHVGLILSNNGRNGFDLRECSNGVGVDTGKRVLRSSLIKLSYHHISEGDGYSTYDKPENNWIEEDQDVTYSIFTYNGNWKDSSAWRKGYELNYVLRPIATDSHDGVYGENNSFIKVFGADNVYISSIKKAEDDDAYILRLFETEGKSTNNVRIYFPLEIKTAYETNLLESEKGKNINISSNYLYIDIKPWEIKTVKLYVR